MNFISKLNSVLSKFSDQECHKYETFSLFGVRKQTPPLAEHYVFDQMPQQLVSCLVDAYTHPFPTDLLAIYHHLNGCALFWDAIYVEKFKVSIPCCKFAIFGVPFGNTKNMVEPWNISIEDLNRPENTPTTWLKFGFFCEPDNPSTRYDLFVDIDSKAVYSVENGIKTCQVTETWGSIDICLCDLLGRFCA